MKLKFVPTLTGALIAALFAYAMYSFSLGQNKELITGGSFLYIAITLILAFGSSFGSARTGTNIRTLAMVFFIAGIASHAAFAYFGSSQPAYIFVNGILLLIFILLSYLIAGAKQ